MELHEVQPASEIDEEPERAPGHKGPTHEAWVIEEGKDGKNYWHRIGFAFTNKDGSLNVQCFANPLDGRMQIRLPSRREETQRADPVGGSRL